MSKIIYRIIIYISLAVFYWVICLKMQWGKNMNVKEGDCNRDGK